MISGSTYHPSDNQGQDAEQGDGPPQVRNPLLCFLCDDYYSEPCLLGCYHTFCARCLRGRELDSKIACPLCGQQTMLRDGTTLPPADLLMRQLIDLANAENPPCANCDKRDKTSMYFCSTCAATVTSEKNSATAALGSADAGRSSVFPLRGPPSFPKRPPTTQSTFNVKDTHGTPPQVPAPYTLHQHAPHEHRTRWSTPVPYTLHRHAPHEHGLAGPLPVSLVENQELSTSGYRWTYPSRRVSVLPPFPLIPKSSEKVAAYLLDKEGDGENNESTLTRKETERTRSAARVNNESTLVPLLDKEGDGENKERSQAMLSLGTARIDPRVEGLKLSQGFNPEAMDLVYNFSVQRGILKSTGLCLKRRTYFI
uniref:RING-type domain-containing protein n=1 Tax=Timema douglasi TaxID=61478 RepID=A0A7R8ZDV6_TIMDO|nr:unnamed protein product [Timema douglasi]